MITEKIRFDLAGRNALITGAVSGIGLATARLLADYGAQVAINYHPDDVRAERVFAELKEEGIDAIAAPCDLSSNYESVKSMVDQVAAKMKNIDYLVCNAATFGEKPVPHSQLDEMTDELWDEILSVNVVGLFRCIRAVKKYLKKSDDGAVVNLASVAGLRRPGSTVAYAASKAAVVKMTLDLGRALGPDIRVNAVAPGFVESPWTLSWSEEKTKEILNKTLVGHLLKPVDIALPIVYLLAGSKYITGQTLVVDSGLSLL